MIRDNGTKMTKEFFKKISFFFGLWLGFVAFPFFANAQVQHEAEAATQNPSCAFQDLIKKLKEIETKLQSSTSEEEQSLLLEQELETRRIILKDASSCALQDVRILSEKVRTLQVIDAEGKELQKQFGSEFEGAVERYESIIASADMLDLQAIRSTAADLLEWRGGTYSSLAERAGNFMLWVKNQELLDKARARLSQTRQTILSFKLAQDENVQDAFSRTRTFLLRSEESNRRAQQSLTRRETPSVSLEHIKNSLNELYRVYETFFLLSDAVKQAFSK